jgi:cytochrome c oxidase cbb3-type subunit 3
MINNEHHDFDGITENREQRPPVYFTVLFYGLIVWGVAFCAFYLLSEWSSQVEFQEKMKTHGTRGQVAATPPAGSPPAPPKTPEPAAAPVTVAAAAATAAKPDGKALFAGKCAMCHGADAKGGFGPDLTKATYEYGRDRENIVATITHGRGNGKMPAFEGQLKREEIFALADYLLTLK